MTLSVPIKAFSTDSPKGTPEEAKDEPYKSYAEATKNTKKAAGLFTTYLTEDGKLYLEINPAQLDSPFLMTINLAHGIGQSDLVTGTPLDNFLCTLHRVGRQVQIIKINPYFTAKEGSPVFRSVEKNFANSVLETMKIVSLGGDGKILLVDATEFFLSDPAGLAKELSDAFSGAYILDPSDSSFESAESFPENTEIETNVNFSSSNPPAQLSKLMSVADWRSILLGIHYSVSSIPKTSYVPRLADDRIGYFVSSIQNFSSSDPDHEITRYINRWDLSRGPIVFWIENTTPLEYRDAIREAVLEWNKAFAVVGFPNALEVNVQPDDAPWNSSDVRYNVIHWINSTDSSFAAFGPSRVNPMTGEIYNASVLIDGDAIQDIKRIYRYELDLRDPASFAGKKSLFQNRLTRICDLPGLLKNDANVAALAMELQAPDPDRSSTPISFLNAYVKDLVMHEVGHCLGLRHNFSASTYLTPAQLQNQSITEKTGLASSVMDYLPLNIALGKKDQGDYFSRTIGVYDSWAIQYGYFNFAAKNPEEELPQLKEIASRSTEPGLAYSTDEDAFSPYNSNPDASAFDLSSNPLEFAVSRFRLYRELWKQIARKLPEPGKSFAQARKAFAMVMSGYKTFSATPTKYIGGVYFSRNHYQLAGAPLPLQPVKKVEEYQALSVLDQYLFSPSAFSFSPKLLQKLAPDRNSGYFMRIKAITTPFNYPILENISEMQEDVLDKLFQPVVLYRILDRERMVKASQEVLTLPEFFQWMTDHFFSELRAGGFISDQRRILQHSYLLHLIRLVVKPKPQTYDLPEEGMEGPHAFPVSTVPLDARNLAEYQLERIKKQMTSALKSSRALNVSTSSHLKASLKLIDASLHAQVQQSIKDEDE